MLKRNKLIYLKFEIKNFILFNDYLEVFNALNFSLLLPSLMIKIIQKMTEK
jgi:hypothetical protein